MRDTQPLRSPPCYPGSEISPKLARLKLWLRSNWLGLFLVAVQLTSITMLRLLPDFLFWIGYRASDGSMRLDPTMYYLVVGSSFILSFLLPGILYLLAARMPLSRALPAQKTRGDLWVALFFLGCGMALLANLPSNWFNDWIGSMLPQLPSGGTGAAAAASSMTVTATVLYVIRTAVLPAFFEEFVFRGILLGQLRAYGNGFAVLLSAVIFGLFHGNFKQIPFAFLVGLVLGFILVQTNNIWIPIAIHFFNNLFACVPDLLRPLLAPDVYLLLYNTIFYGVIVLGAFAALYLLARRRDIFLPRSFSCQPMSLISRLLLWMAAPGTLLIVAFCVVDTVTNWI